MCVCLFGRLTLCVRVCVYGVCCVAGRGELTQVMDVHVLLGKPFRATASRRGWLLDRRNKKRAEKFLPPRTGTLVLPSCPRGAAGAVLPRPSRGSQLDRAAFKISKHPAAAHKKYI